MQFTHPISSKGEKRAYLAFIEAVIAGKVKRQELMNNLGRPNASSKSYSSWLAELSKQKILNYNTALKKWEQGERFHEYLGFVLCQLYEHPKYQKQIKALFIKDTPSTTFQIPKILEEL